MKDLILSYATNARFDDFYRFIASARRRCDPREVDVAILTDALGDEFAAAALEHDVTLVPVENVWRWARVSGLLNVYFHAAMAALRAGARLAPRSQRPWFRAAYRHTAGGWLHPLAGRWVAYHSYLRVNSGYRVVLASDLRDVVFQSSPFDEVDPDALHVFEQAGIRYGEDNVDSRWYRRVFGESALAGMAGRAVLCAGTVLGGSGPLLRLLERMDDAVLERPRTPLDQAIFNDVVARRLDGVPVVRHDLRSGPVLTLSGAHRGAWEIADGRILIDGRPAPVVHMYDRDPDARALVFGQLPVPGPSAADAPAG